MQNQEKDKDKEKDKNKLIDSIFLEEDLEEDEEIKIKKDYERLQKLDEEDLSRCIKCGKKIEMQTYFCNSTCDDEFIKEKEQNKENAKE